MELSSVGRKWLVLVAVAFVWCPGWAASAASGRPLSVTWMSGFHAPGTPAKYEKVGVLKGLSCPSGGERASRFRGIAC
jgi:hypothetical protein